MRLLPQVTWTPDDGGSPLDPRLPALLAAVAERGTLAAACGAAGLPYRSGWGLMRDAGERLGRPLVAMARGRGARLTADGEAWLAAHGAALRRLGDAALALGEPPAVAVLPVLRIAASHDIALAQLRDALPASGPLRVELAFMGSVEALEAYARGRADLAGFHVAPELLHDAAFAGLRRALRPARDRLIRFAAREQGLIVPAGNPRRVRTLADVAAKRLRFVNRQPGSGTRLLVDALLARDGIAPQGIRGYATAEHNHVAAAAAVASGGADVAFGLRAAAAEFGLGFVPLAREQYRFAVRARAVAAPATAAFLAALRGPLLARSAVQLPGYDVSRAGTLEAVSRLADTGPARQRS
jgi:molybdate transport repressor ModE-like protein